MAVTSSCPDLTTITCIKNLKYVIKMRTVLWDTNIPSWQKCKLINVPYPQ